MGIGERIASERKRLGLSQEEFANRAGISLSSQKRYEKGDREPDSAYLAAVRELGVDVGFVLFARRASEELTRYLSTQVVLNHIAKALGICGDKLYRLVDMAEEEERRAHDGLPPTNNDSALVYRHAFELTAEAIAHHPGEIDSNLLAEVLGGMDSVGAGVLAPDKKARVAALLYRAFKAGGKVDPTMIEEAVKLAAS